ncbi:MAG: pyruvate kinase [Gammaproteobacteria bacterium]|nr:pyruvate kinase [Gammaproteobacteria bacterium]MBU2057847.1 pyruvate kinase [Gammaproteobacteria bacterium]MBU2176718.1 pyruvate kinase [Gammaproteobacteria bacterium]MBU2247851.1 pyruvate kinase [Gammaproteobacteria bacterium]MBU2346024.1 pyruvate kinase [Gammaproteobacteria bacterium]
MPRRTKIVATLGPATNSQAAIEKLILAGASVFRFNFSHGSAEDHKQRAEMVRAAAAKTGVHVAILGDLQGPKIRVSTFKNSSVILEEDQHFVLDADLPKGEGDETQVGIDYKELPADVQPGDVLLLDDGRIQMVVEHVVGQRIHTKVSVAGKLSNNKGINRLGGGLSAPALTEKDKTDISLAAYIDVDYLAVSFPRCGDDLRIARELARAAGSEALIVSKVERAEAVADDETLDDIIRASDAVMVARGDLGVEIGDAELVGQQKRIIARSRQLNRVVITATQMMESMIESPMPTRAEVMDVANAVLDGTDAVMLSGETAAGRYPTETVKAMARVCDGAEKHPRVQISKHRMDVAFTEISETIALSAMYAANHLTGIKAIISLTESGYTAKLMSRITSSQPIYALSRHQKTLNKMALYRGVYPVFFDSTQNLGQQKVSAAAIEAVQEIAHLKSGDLVILTYGDMMETVGASNTCKIVQIS